MFANCRSGLRNIKRATHVIASTTLHTPTSKVEIVPEEIGTALARDFIQAQWLRLHIGAQLEMSKHEMEDWCPLPRLRFRLPPWWQAHDLIIEDDETLFNIYRSFAAELNKIAHSSDDPALNKTIMTALNHIAHVLPPHHLGNDTIIIFETPIKPIIGDQDD